MSPNPRQIARQRMLILYERARNTYESDPELSKRYTELIKRIAQRTRTHPPSHIRREICRKCNTILIPGVSSRVRIRQRREPHVAITCIACGHVTRIPIRRTRI